MRKTVSNFNKHHVMLSLSKHGAIFGAAPFDKLRVTAIVYLAFFCLLLLPQNPFAAEHGRDHLQIFHAFTVEADAGEARDGSARGWDLDGWIGGDINRLWLKSEKKTFGQYERKSEIQALYSRNISQFWDGQFGLRHDFRTDFSSEQVNYLSLGIEGLAPYFFETDAHVFLSDQGNFSARLKQEIDLLLTQKLIAQPYFEADFFAQNLPELEVKSGLAELELGITTRYEISRKFAPYLALRYHRKTFGTADLAKQTGERADNFIAAIGLRLKF
jgi:copper resistance protein B